MDKLKLVIGNKNYSSWSLRAWLLMRQAGVDFEEIQVPLHQEDTKTRVRQYSGSGKVPCLVNGPLRIWESIAICEYVAELFPEKRLWPEDREARAFARCVAAEMHAGFTALRSNMTMNCRASYPDKGRAPGVQEDIDRIFAIWRECREKWGSGGDFLFGHFTAADAMYAPVVLRFRTYAVPLDTVCRAYSDAMLALPALQEWLDAAAKEPWVIPIYEYSKG